MKTETKLNPKFIARNAQFKKAGAAAKRILIVKDVLSQLAARKIKPKNSIWVVFPASANKTPEAQICDITEKVSCECCALGSMMLSEVRFNDNLTLEDTEYPDTNIYGEVTRYKMDFEGSENRLPKYFSKFQLDLIEAAYELGEGYNWIDIEFPEDYSKQEIAAVKFGKKFKSNSARLKGICENIIENNGTFKP